MIEKVDVLLDDAIMVNVFRSIFSHRMNAHLNVCLLFSFIRSRSRAREMFDDNFTGKSGNITFRSIIIYVFEV